MNRIALFAVGSPIVAEYEETCRRQGITVVVAVRNHPGEAFAASDMPVVEVSKLVAEHRAVPCTVPLFRPLNRRRAVQEATDLGFTFADALIDPTAILASSVAAGDGTFVNAGCVIGAQTVLGEHVLVNRSASIGHHVVLEALVSIGPGAVIAGNAVIGTGAMIGAGAVLLPSVRIGAGAVVGAGSVVTRDVPMNGNVRGNPARPAE